MDAESREKDRRPGESLEARWWRWFKEGKSSPNKIRIGEFGFSVHDQHVRFLEPTPEQIQRCHRLIARQPHKNRSLSRRLGRHVYEWRVQQRSRFANEQGSSFESFRWCGHKHTSRRKAVACARRSCYALILRAVLGPKQKVAP